MHTGELPANGLADLAEVAELAVVVPVYNEAPALPIWFEEWDVAFSRAGVFPLIVFIDDCSIDESSVLLWEYCLRRGAENTVVLRNENRAKKGHGNACFLGYRFALSKGPKWILQLDSDGQCDPSVFSDMWTKRSESVPVFGCRTSRLDGPMRMTASFIVRAVTSAVFQVRVPDPNSPYRLMPSRLLHPLLDMVPEGFVLKNIAIAALFAKYHGTIRIMTTFRLRTHPCPEKKLGFFALNGVRLFRDLILLRLFARAS